jgi:hypothetical protein
VIYCFGIQYFKMSLNTAHANGGVLIHAGEWLVMYYVISLYFKETWIGIEFSRSVIRYNL